jgi:hypothetical protein
MSISHRIASDHHPRTHRRHRCCRTIIITIAHPYPPQADARLEHLLKTNVSPLANRVQVDGDLGDGDVVLFFQEFSWLSVVFRAYASQHRGDAGMSRKQFEMFVKDCQIVEHNKAGGLDEQVIMHVYKKVLHAPEGSSAALMSYHEFLESLAALAVYKLPDPYITLKHKIQQLIQSIFTIMKKKFRRLLPQA